MRWIDKLAKSFDRLLFDLPGLIVFWCERRDLLCSHSKGDIFTSEDNMLFSHMKISSFRAKAHLVFHWRLYNKIDSHTTVILTFESVDKNRAVLPFK